MSTHLIRFKNWLILLAFLSVSPVAWAAACSVPPAFEARLQAHADADAYAALGAWFSQNHRLDCAVEAYQSGLKLEPGSARLDDLLGLAFFAAGRMQEAVAPLRQSIRIHPQESRAHLLLGAALATLGRDKEALPEWEAALRIDPASKAALDGLAKNLISAGGYQTVIDRLASAPRDENLTLDLAVAYRNAGRLDDAAETLTQGLKAYPNSLGLTGALVPIYLNESRFAAASAVAERLARLNPDDIEAQRIDLRTLVIIGDNDAAAPLGRKLLALSPEDAEFLNLNGVLERKAGDYPAARDHLEKALALNPNDYNSRIDLGSVLAELKDNAGAREQFEKAIKLGANKPQVYFELAKALRALGEAEEARRQLEFYKQRVKENDETTAAMLRETEAAGAAKAGDNRKAAELYGEASAAQPHDARLAYRLALALGELGDIAGERAALERAIQADPNFVSAQYQLGYLDSREGDNAAAEKQFRLVVEAAPGNLQGWISLAAILGNESRFQEAQEALENALRLEPDSASALTLSRRLAAEQGHL